MIGASCGHKGVVQVLLNSGADVTCRNEVVCWGELCVHDIVIWLDPPIFKGRTALKEGLESENVDVVKLLIKAENEIEQQVFFLLAMVVQLHFSPTNFQEFRTVHLQMSRRCCRSNENKRNIFKCYKSCKFDCYVYAAV